MFKVKAPSVLRAPLVAGVPRDRAQEIAEAAARLSFNHPRWQHNPPDQRVIPKLNRAICQPLVRREEREAA